MGARTDAAGAFTWKPFDQGEIGLRMSMCIRTNRPGRAAVIKKARHLSGLAQQESFCPETPPLVHKAFFAHIRPSSLSSVMGIRLPLRREATVSESPQQGKKMLEARRVAQASCKGTWEMQFSCVPRRTDDKHIDLSLSK